MKFGPMAFQTGLIWLGLLMPLALYGTATLKRPARIDMTRKPLFEGIVYSRHLKTQPRPLVIHLLEIDLTAPGLSPFVTPSFKTDLSVDSTLGRETLAQRTSDFLQEHQLQLAVNANFFFPFREETLWDYEPRQGTPSMLSGLAMSNGQIVSLPQAGQTALCFLSQRAEIASNGQCPEGTEQAVAGNTRLLNEGEPTKGFWAVVNGEKADRRPYPVNIAAIDASGRRLWLILCDGKQPLYSEGIMLSEVVDLVQSLGAETAVRLDGGGSTTVAIASDTGPQILNAVIHGKIPGQERPVANHLGFFAQPLQP
jgi:hypothetical protein